MQSQRARFRLALAGILLGPLAHAQPADVPWRDLWVPNGPVHAILVTNRTAYIGGSFTSLGKATGGGAMLYPNTGSLHPNSPPITGQILVAQADGWGGFFVGGQFTSIRQVAIANLARISATGDVDPNFRPAVSGPVRALAVGQGTLYFAGTFSSVGGTFRNGAAAVDAATGQLKPWDARVGGGQVNALAWWRDRVILAGTFTTVAGGNRLRFSGTDAVTGDATEPDINFSSAPNCLLVVGNTLYAAGPFARVEGEARNLVAAINLESGALLNWNTNAFTQGSGTIFSIAANSTNLYVAGNFTSIAGALRRSLAALALSTGTVLNWNPNSNGLQFASFTSLAIASNALYVGGSFPYFANTASGRSNVAAVDVSSGRLLPFNASLNANVSALGVSENSLFAGGNFTFAGGASRPNLAALSLDTGEPTAWNPLVGYTGFPGIPAGEGLVKSMALVGQTLYIGGYFNRVDNQARSGLAALDTRTNTNGVRSWTATVSGGVVENILPVGEQIFLGGTFDSINGSARRGLAAVNATNGATLNFDPLPHEVTNTAVHSMVVQGINLLVGGEFSSMSGLFRRNLASFDLETGALGNWNPDANDVVNAVAVSGGTVYAGGFFTTIALRARASLAAISATTGKPTAWAPVVEGQPTRLAVSSGMLYTAGNIRSLGGEARQYLGALDEFTGLVLPWNPSPNGLVESLAVTPGWVLVGGRFTQISGVAQPYFAAYPVRAPSEAPEILVQTIERSPDGTISFQVKSMAGQRLLVQSSADLANWTVVSTNTPGTATHTDSTPATASAQRFFRAVLEK